MFALFSSGDPQEQSGIWPIGAKWEINKSAWACKDVPQGRTYLKI